MAETPNEIRARLLEQNRRRAERINRPAAADWREERQRFREARDERMLRMSATASTDPNEENEENTDGEQDDDE